ncbi:MAG: glycosyltransferase family 4 protein [Gaiellales bacterium]
MNERTTERTVLHVLPHPGGGGETYVDLLAEMKGYRFDRAYLAGSPSPSPVELARGVSHVLRRAGSYDLLHVHGEVAAGLCLPRLWFGRSIVTLHGLHLVRRLHGARLRLAVLNLRAMVRVADRTICVSQTEYDELARLAGAAATRRAVVIRNGVRIPPAPTEQERASIRKELGLAAEELVAIWVGSLDERKDPLTAVRAAEAAGVTLLVVGDGPLRGVVERAAGETVRVLGRRDDVPRLLAAADVYISTSHREGLSLSLLEAMAAGLTPIVTDLPENVEAVGDTGITFAAGDVAAAADALRRLLVPASEAAVLGGRAHERVVAQFHTAAMVAVTRALYEDRRPSS